MCLRGRLKLKNLYKMSCPPSFRNYLSFLLRSNLNLSSVYLGVEMKDSHRCALRGSRSVLRSNKVTLCVGIGGGGVGWSPEGPSHNQVLLGSCSPNSSSLGKRDGLEVVHHACRIKPP